MRFCAKITGLILGSLLAGSAAAQEAQPSQYQLKAAFLYHFAQFTSWPPASFADNNSPLIIGVLGDNPFGHELEQLVSGKTVNNHPLEIRQFRQLVEGVTNCHILFISSSEKKRLPEIFASLRGASLLTVGDTDHFIESGGIINFVLQENKIRFQINEEGAKTAGLKLSSKLLSLAIRRAA